MQCGTIIWVVAETSGPDILRSMTGGLTTEGDDSLPSIVEHCFVADEAVCNVDGNVMMIFHA